MCYHVTFISDFSRPTLQIVLYFEQTLRVELILLTKTGILTLQYNKDDTFPLKKRADTPTVTNYKNFVPKPQILWCYTGL